MKRRSRAIALLSIGLVLLFWNGALGAATYFVSSSGNNDRDGLALETAWRTIQKCAGVAQAGDTCRVQEGTYNEDVIRFEKSGTAENWITYTCDGTCLVKGSNKNVLNFGFYIIRASYLKFTGFTLSNFFNGIQGEPPLSYILIEKTKVSDTMYDGIGLGGGITDVTLDSVDVSGFGDHGILIIALQDGQLNQRVTIRNCRVHDNTNESGQYHNAIDIHTNISNALIEGNEVWNIRGDQSAMYIHNWNVSDVVIRGNHLHEVDRGIQFIGVRNSLIEGNTIENVRTYAMAFYQDTAGREPNDGLIFRNNTIRNHQINEACVWFQMFHNQCNNQNILFEGNSISACSNDQAYGFYAPLDKNIVIRDQVESNFKILVSGSAPAESFVEYSDGLVFSENSVGVPHWYPERSNLALNDNETITISTYSMTAKPTTAVATVAVQKFDTSLPKGNVLVEFTADTTDGNDLLFSIGTLVGGLNYQVKKGGVDLAILQAEPAGTIAFANSAWPAAGFTVEETSGGAPFVGTPVFSPPGGVYAVPQTVVISTPTAGATIHFTTDGSAPTESVPEYSAALAISTTTTIKAAGWKVGYNPSPVASATYVISPGADGGADAGEDSSPDDSPGPDGGPDGATAADGPSKPVSGGCSCNGGSSETQAWLALAILGFGAALGRRRTWYTGRPGIARAR